MQEWCISNSMMNTNKKRNLVEHEYISVKHQEAVDFVDIADMFLLLSYLWLSMQWLVYTFGWKTWQVPRMENSFSQKGDSRFHSPLRKIYRNVYRMYPYDIDEENKLLSSPSVGKNK